MFLKKIREEVYLFEILKTRGSSQHSCTSSQFIIFTGSQSDRVQKATAVSYSVGQERRVDKILAAVQLKGQTWRSFFSNFANSALDPAVNLSRIKTVKMKRQWRCVVSWVSFGGREWGVLQDDVRKWRGFHCGWRDIPLPIGQSSPELSKESGQSVQHGASSIPPAGCLGPVWDGLLTTGPITSQHPCRDRPMHAAVSVSSAAQATAGFISALAWDCHINIYRIV